MRVMSIEYKHFRIRTWIAFFSTLFLHVSLAFFLNRTPFNERVKAVTSVSLATRFVNEEQVSKREVPQIASPLGSGKNMTDNPEYYDAFPSSARLLSIPKKLLYFIDELDSQPTPIAEILPTAAHDYPAEIHGRAEFSLLITETGAVTWIGIDFSEFDESILQPIVENLMRSRFTPGIFNGDPVATVMRIEVKIANGVSQ